LARFHEAVSRFEAFLRSLVLFFHFCHSRVSFGFQFSIFFLEILTIVSFPSLLALISWSWSFDLRSFCSVVFPVGLHGVFCVCSLSIAANGGNCKPQSQNSFTISGFPRLPESRPLNH
jgi:hypothetical protein